MARSGGQFRANSAVMQRSSNRPASEPPPVFIEGSGCCERAPRLSRVELVLTLLSRKEEGHLAYRSQSDNPLQGTTLGGSTDDPGREHTRDATACHAAGGDDGRQRGVPGSWDLPHVVLSPAPATAAVCRRWSASPSFAIPALPPPPRP